MKRKKLQKQLLALVDGNPDIPTKIQKEIINDIDRFTDRAVMNMILYINEYYMKVTNAYKKVDYDLKCMVRQAEMVVEQFTRNKEEELIKDIEENLKKAK